MTDLTRFDKNTIVFEQNANPTPPNSSGTIKVFNKDNQLYKIDFAGNISPLNQTEISYYQTEVVADADAAQFTFTIPNPAKGLEQLKQLVNNLHEASQERIEEVSVEIRDIIETLRKESTAGDEELDIAIEELREDITSLLKDISAKVNTDLFDVTIRGINKDIDNLSISIFESLNLKANRSELEELEATLRATISSVSKSIPQGVEVLVGDITTGTEGRVQVRQEDNKYFIDVVFPDIKETISGGVSRKTVKKIIEESVVSGKQLTSPDGSLQIVETDDEWQLQVDTSSITGGKGFTPLEGDGIIIEEVGDDYRFSVDDYISKTEVSNVSGGLSTRIDEIVEEGTTLDSPNGSITIIKDDLHFDIDVDDYIGATEVATISAGLDGRITTIEDDYLKEADISDFITTSEVASISSGLDGRITTIEDDYLKEADISEFITTSEVAGISGNLQSQINEIEEEQTVIVAGEGIEVVEDPTHTWTVSVTGEYLTEEDISDFITTSEVASISSGLDSRITTIEDDYVVASDLNPYTLLTITEAISSNLQTQIDEIEEEQTVIVAGEGIGVVEDPTHTWTVSVTGEIGSDGKEYQYHYGKLYEVVRMTSDEATAEGWEFDEYAAYVQLVPGQSIGGVVRIPDYINDKPVIQPFLVSSLFSNNPEIVSIVGGLNFHLSGDPVGITNCANLETIDLPVVTIGRGFGYNTSLNSVNLPSLYRIVLGDAFEECTSLETISLPNLTFLSESGGPGPYGDLFRNCTSLKNVYLPKLTELGGFAFFGCIELVDIDLPEVTILKGTTFQNCTTLQSIRLPKLVNLDGVSNFRNCPALTSLYLGDVPVGPTSQFVDTPNVIIYHEPEAEFNGEYLDRPAVPDLNRWIVEHGDAPDGSAIIRDGNDYVWEADFITSSDLDDYITTVEVAGISGDLDGRITTIEDDYVTNSDISDFITTSEVAGISGDLQTQIDDNKFDMYSSLVETEVSITEATTLTSSAFGKNHVVSGTTADYDIDLPAASGNSGKIIGFRIAGSATKLFTIKGNGTEEIDGENERVMWAGESAILLCDGSGWTKVAGKSVPFVINGEKTTSQSANANVNTKLIYETVTEPKSGIFSSSTFTVPRRSNWNMTVNLVADSGGSAHRILAAYYINGNLDRLLWTGHNSSTSGAVFSGGCVSNLYNKNELDKNDEFEFWFRINLATTIAGNNTNSFSITEIPTW